MLCPSIHSKDWNKASRSFAAYGARYWRVLAVMQMRYAAGTKDVLDRFFNNKPLKKDDVIVEVDSLLDLCCSCVVCWSVQGEVMTLVVLTFLTVQEAAMVPLVRFM